MVSPSKLDLSPGRSLSTAEQVQGVRKAHRGTRGDWGRLQTVLRATPMDPTRTGGLWPGLCDHGDPPLKPPCLRTGLHLRLVSHIQL